MLASGEDKISCSAPFLRLEEAQPPSVPGWWGREVQPLGQSKNPREENPLNQGAA